MSALGLSYGILLALSLNLPQPEQPALAEAQDVLDVMKQAPHMQTARFAASRLSKWNQVRDRFHGQMSDPLSQAAPYESAWIDMVQAARVMDPTRRLAWANDRMNAVRYISDDQNWGRADYWATPIEFLQRGGDCEDYAIAKYELLHEAGVPTNQMQILVSKNHAVLVVEAPGGPVVLDSLRRRPYRFKANLAKKAVFAFNDNAWVVGLGQRSDRSRSFGGLSMPRRLTRSDRVPPKRTL